MIRILIEHESNDFAIEHPIFLIVESSINECPTNLNVAVDCANGATSRVINDITFPDNISLNIFNNSPNGVNINDKCGAVYPEYLSNIISKCLLILLV